MKAGKLRHRIEIQDYTESQDGTTGAVTKSWSTFAEVWAAIEPLSAKEFMAAQSEQSKVSVRVTLRYRDDLQPNMRLYHAATGRILEIQGVLPDKDSGLEYITLPCSELEDVG